MTLQAAASCEDGHRLPLRQIAQLLADLPGLGAFETIQSLLRAAWAGEKISLLIYMS